MSSVETENMIVGLDIGTSKVVAIVGKRKMAKWWALVPILPGASSVEWW
jgi:cell division ATPase FtsA